MLQPETQMTIKVGDRLPDVKFKIMGSDGPADLASSDVFKGKKVAFFAVPGAFTPTCHRNHLPGYLEHAAALHAKGVDIIAVTAVNDVFVMNEWKKATGAGDKIVFLADGAAVFAKAIGLDLDATVPGLGIRSKRYAMLVDDGVVKVLNVEDVPSKADASSAVALLKEI